MDMNDGLWSKKVKKVVIQTYMQQHTYFLLHRAQLAIRVDWENIITHHLSGLVNTLGEITPHREIARTNRVLQVCLT